MGQNSKKEEYKKACNILIVRNENSKSEEYAKIVHYFNRDRSNSRKEGYKKPSLFLYSIQRKQKPIRSGQIHFSVNNTLKLVYNRKCTSWQVYIEPTEIHL